MSGKWSHHVAIRGSIATKCGTRRLHRLLKESGCAIVERMSKRSRGKNPLQPVLLKRKRAHKWRGKSKRMNCRADIVLKAWQCELLCAAATAYRYLRLQTDN